MKKVLLKKEKNIKDLIYEIRGHQVMLDSDLAMLYECKMGPRKLIKQLKIIKINFLKGTVLE